MRPAARRLSGVAAAGLVAAGLAVAGLAAARLAGASPAEPEAARELSPELSRRAEALRERGLDSSLAYELVRSLAVEVGPRFAGSDGDRRGVEWARRKMEELGLGNVRTEPVTVPRWERGENRGEVTAPFPQAVVLTALGGSVATPPGGLEAEVLRVDSLDALRALPEGAAAGKIVFIDEVMERTRDGSGYGRAVRKRGAGASEAAKKGAVALLIRSAGTSSNRVAHTGAMRYEAGVPQIPAAALSNPDSDLLAAQFPAAPAPAGAAADRPVRFRLQLDTRILPDATSANVIGEVRGREHPEEVVLLGAHLDSWDLAQGAVDDGAGCAIVLAAAKLLAEEGRAPRRTVRVVLFANEEFGLSGARAYAEAHAAEMPRHVGAFEADFGTGVVWSFSSRVAPDRLPVVAAVAGLLAPLGIEASGNEARGGADLSPLRPHRVPVFGLAQDGTLYFDVHHTANDTLAQIDPKGLAQNVAAHAVLAWALAEWDGDWGRAPEEAAGAR